MAYEHITIVGGGIPYEGWEHITVEASVEKAGFVSFIAGTTETAEPHEIGTAFDNWNFPPGSSVTVYAGHDLVVSGIVSIYNPSADADQHSIILRGDTKSMDGMKSMYKSENGGTFEHETATGIVKAMYQQFGIGVDVRANDTRRIPLWQVRPGATVYAESMRLLQHGMLLVGRPDGSIAIIDGDPFMGTGVLMHGVNILSQSAELTDLHYRSYEVLGQHPFGTKLQQHIQAFGNAFNYSQQRTGRHKVIIDQTATSPELAKARAEWEKNRASGFAERAYIRTPGWRRHDGKFWDINIDTYVYAPWLKIDCIMRTYSVSMKQNLSDGTVTDLVLVDPRALGRRGMAGVGRACASGDAWVGTWEQGGGGSSP